MGTRHPSIVIRHAGIGIAAVLAASSAAHAQSLSDRINEVMRQRAAEQAAEYERTRGGMLRALLRTGITVDFAGMPAKQAFGVVKQMLKIDLEGRWASDNGATGGLDPEAPITLSTTGVALDVIERMLEQCSNGEPATWQLRKGYVEYGTKARLNSKGAQDMRIYPIRDLLFEAPMFDNAPEFNLNQSISQGGGGGGGTGGGGSGGGGGGMGGGGFGGGGGGGGGSGGGGGGGIFGSPGEPPERRSLDERTQSLVQLITGMVEPDVWLDETVASIRIFDGNLIIRAPDYVHRQIGGYGELGPGAPRQFTGRYVDMNGSFAANQVNGFTPATVTGAAGGNGGNAGGGNGSRGGAGGGTGGSGSRGGAGGTSGGTGGASGTGAGGASGTKSGTADGKGGATGTGGTTKGSTTTP